MNKSFSKLMIVTAILVAVAIGVSLLSISGNGYGTLTELVGVVLSPVHKVVNWAADSFSGFAEYFYRYDRLKVENEQLKDEIAAYKQLESRYYGAIDENTSLRVLARITAENPTYDYEFSSVTSINIEGYNKVITIDKGSLDGIDLFDCAVVREGVVGYVTKVGTNFAEITIITDPNMKIGAIVTRPQEVAVAEGSADHMEEGKLRLAYLSTESGAAPRDMIETSGYGDIFPKGLVIGYIDEIFQETHGMSNYAVVTPAVDFSQLKKLYVIKDFQE